MAAERKLKVPKPKLTPILNYEVPQEIVNEEENEKKVPGWTFVEGPAEEERESEGVSH